MIESLSLLLYELPKALNAIESLSLAQWYCYFRNSRKIWSCNISEPIKRTVRWFPLLLSVVMISLPSVKTFCTIIVLLFLSEFSHIYAFNTAIRHAAKPQTHSLPSVSDPAFSFRSIRVSKYQSWGIIHRSNPLLHEHISCSWTGHCYIYLLATRQKQS